ncbi:MAG: hypothetical protein IPG89_07160 [Bacteroidetes bacterium]|nr:hypothetical protein [Bacteroidota bacterium]
MSDLIKSAIDSEYNNVGELMGIDDALMGEVSELMGRMKTADKVKFLRKISSKSNLSRGLQNLKSSLKKCQKVLKHLY